MADDHHTPHRARSETQPVHNKRQSTKKPHDKPLSLYPLSENDILRKLMNAGQLPDKQHAKAKQRHHGATTTPKSKPKKGK